MDGPERTMTRTAFAIALAANVPDLSQETRDILANTALEFIEKCSFESVLILHSFDVRRQMGDYTTTMSYKAFCNALAKYNYKGNDEVYRENINSLSLFYINTYNGHSLVIMSPQQALEVSENALSSDEDEFFTFSKEPSPPPSKSPELFDSDDDDDFLFLDLGKPQQPSKALDDEEDIIMRKRPSKTACLRIESDDSDSEPDPKAPEPESENEEEEAPAKSKLKRLHKEDSDDDD